MIDSYGSKRCMGRTEIPDLKRLRASLGLAKQNHPRERNGAHLRVRGGVCATECLTSPTLSEMRYFNNHEWMLCRVWEKTRRFLTPNRIKITPHTA
jgi:hypothetical protein